MRLKREANERDVQQQQHIVELESEVNKGKERARMQTESDGDDEDEYDEEEEEDGFFNLPLGDEGRGTDDEATEHKSGAREVRPHPTSQRPTAV